MTRFDDGYETAIHFPGSTGPPVSLRATVEAFEQTLLELDSAVLRPIPTGFPQLDANMGGGLHAEDLVLVVGKQNVGKTLFVCQLGRPVPEPGRLRADLLRALADSPPAATVLGVLAGRR